MNDKQEQFTVKFWGTRGSLAVSGDAFAKTGGNTCCVEVTCGNETIILDGGTGLLPLGAKIAAKGTTNPIHLMLTHAHYDHVEGIPFFAPLFRKCSKVNFYSGELEGCDNTKALIQGFMKKPYFPIGTDCLSADLAYHDLAERDSFTLGNEVKITTAPLNHPGKATGYRIDFAGKSLAYITDTNHVPGKHCDNILHLIQNVDMMIYDCSYTANEHPKFLDFGHSTFEQSVELAGLGNAKAIYAFHHIPQRTDKDLEQIVSGLTLKDASMHIARQGDVIKLA